MVFDYSSVVLASLVKKQDLVVWSLIAKSVRSVTVDLLVADTCLIRPDMPWYLGVFQSRGQALSVSAAWQAHNGPLFS